MREKCRGREWGEKKWKRMEKERGREKAVTGEAVGRGLGTRTGNRTPQQHRRNAAKGLK